MKENMIKIGQKYQKIEELKESINLTKTSGQILCLSSLATMLMGSVIAPLPTAIFGLISVFELESKENDLVEQINMLKKEYLEIEIEAEKFRDQIKFLKHLTKLIDNHYEEAFKNCSFKKEEEICKQIKLNSPNQMDSKLIKELKNQKQELLKSQEGNHYNILVLGRTGVGKSTLINVVLDLKGENAAKENAVKPETGANYIPPNFNNNEIIEIGNKNKFSPIEYTSKKSSLVLLDSRGIEISNNYNIDIAAEDIIEFISKRNALNSNPDKFIHCVWYLVSGNRFEDDEGKYVKSLKRLYSNFGLPIIFVYSQAINEKDGNLIKERIEELIGEKINFKQIIARDIEIKTENKKRKPMIVEAYGVFEEEDGLIQMSFEHAKNAIKSSYFNYVKNLLKTIFVRDINYTVYLCAQNYIYFEIKWVIFEQEKSLEELRNSFENIFVKLIKLFLIDEEPPQFNEYNKKLIKKYFNCFPNLNDPKLIELLDILKKKEMDKLIGNYMDINIEAEERLGLKNKQGKKEIKNMIQEDVVNPLKKRIPYIALSYILLKYLNLLCEKLYEQLCTNFEESYDRIKDKTSKELKSIINKVYDNIMKRCWLPKEE